MRLVGFPMIVAGLGLLVTDIVGLLAEAGPFVKVEYGETSPTTLSWIFLGAGAALGLPGAIMFSSYGYLTDAANYYNRAVFKNAATQPWSGFSIGTDGKNALMLNFKTGF
ncbi:MAG: hypothetical protein FJ088_11820 [Deltaproteobacteria bacterium]|nr:hypothetical protein [Deltaproteobacteria bacterium]